MDVQYPIVNEAYIVPKLLLLKIIVTQDIFFLFVSPFNDEIVELSDQVSDLK